MDCSGILPALYNDTEKLISCIHIVPALRVTGDEGTANEQLKWPAYVVHIWVDCVRPLLRNHVMRKFNRQ